MGRRGEGVGGGGCEASVLLWLDEGWFELYRNLLMLRINPMFGQLVWDHIKYAAPIKPLSVRAIIVEGLEHCAATKG